MKVELANVRLSFPDLFTAKAFQKEEPKFGATFLLNKDSDKGQIESLRAAVLSVAKDKWGANLPKGLKYCIANGDEKEYDGYANTIYIRASTRKRPPIVNWDLTPLAETDNVIYAGCFVNAKIDLWAQDNEYGKRINAMLLGIQFAHNGDAFGNSFNAQEEFKVLEAPQGYSTANDGAEETRLNAVTAELQQTGGLPF